MKLQILILGLLISSNALAINGTGILNINLTPSCTIQNATINLGDYTPDVSKAMSAQINHECSTGVQYTISVSKSTQMSGTTRHLKSIDSNNNDTFQYNLYKNSAKEHWGDSVSDRISEIGTGENKTSTVFIEAISGQFITPGVYKETLTMTLTY